MPEFIQINSNVTEEDARLLDRMMVEDGFDKPFRIHTAFDSDGVGTPAQQTGRYETDEKKGWKS